MGKIRSGLIALSLTTGLFSMNRLEFNDIQIGMPISKVICAYGEPYAAYDLGDGTVKFEFVERISMNNELVYENHYYLTVANDRVVGKCFKEENRPPFDQLYQVDPNYPTYP